MPKYAIKIGNVNLVCKAGMNIEGNFKIRLSVEHLLLAMTLER